MNQHSTRSDHLHGL